jgi:adenosylmethionine-8-amino-7-oxononanoate aminotransferase
MLIAEPVQNAGGCLVPPDGYWQGLRELCDRRGILLVSDEVICAFGRIGTWFGAQRLGYEPDMITFAKGLTGAHFPMGGLLISERVAAPFLEGKEMYLHGITFGGHPVASAVALANLDVFESERLLDNVRANEAAFAAMLDSLRDIPIVGDVRGLGYFWAIELVKDRATKQTFSEDECEWLLRGFLSAEIFKRGLICRADDRGDPVIQLAPPLIAGPEQFEEIRTVLRPALEEASRRLDLS